MAKEIQNIKSFKILEMNSKEFFSTGGLSICDSCCTPMEKGYYIAVLNSAYCEKHYLQWYENAINYPEDRSFESMVFERMKTHLLNEKAL